MLLACRPTVPACFARSHCKNFVVLASPSNTSPRCRSEVLTTQQLRSTSDQTPWLTSGMCLISYWLEMTRFSRSGAVRDNSDSSPSKMLAAHSSWFAKRLVAASECSTMNDSSNLCFFQRCVVVVAVLKLRTPCRGSTVPRPVCACTPT